MKIAIIIHSETDTTQKAADYVAQGILSVQDTELCYFRLSQEESWDTEYLQQCRAVVFGTPTYYANMCWQMKRFFDTTAFKYEFCGKLGSAFATEGSPQGGGAELAIMGIYSHLLVHGMLVYSSGVEYGKPTIHFGPTVVRTQLPEREEILTIYGKRIALKAHELFDGRE